MRITWSASTTSLQVGQLVTTLNFNTSWQLLNNVWAHPYCEHDLRWNTFYDQSQPSDQLMVQSCLQSSNNLLGDNPNLIQFHILASGTWSRYLTLYLSVCRNCESNTFPSDIHLINTDHSKAQVVRPWIYTTTSVLYATEPMFSF